MEPLLKNNDKKMFYNLLNKCKVYFEYGSGGSTYQASIRENIQKIYSVESDGEWHNKLKSIIKNKRVNYIYSEIENKPNTWGYPGKNATEEQKINYSNQLNNLTLDEKLSIDLLFIDGRFRVACCLKCFNIVSENCIIVFDDFIPRKNYYIVLDYFDIVNKTQDNNTVVLQKKKNITHIPESIIKEYELDPR
jgi:hypothetical protein